MRKRVLVQCMRMCVLVIVATKVVQATPGEKIPVTTKSEEAKKEFLKARELFEKLELTNSLQHYDQAIALDPTFAWAHLGRATAATTAQEFFGHLKAAVASSGKVSEGERLLILATDAGSTGNAAKQEEYLKKLVTAYPDDERAQFALGGFYFGQQNFDQAIAHYRKAISLAPNYSPAYNILGYAYRQVESYDEAEKVFKKYTELIPNDPNPYDSYAELLLKMGRFDASIAMYQKALAVDKEFIASHIGIATNYVYKEMHEKAAEELKSIAKWARTDGERRQALFTQMVVNVDAGKMEEALKDVDRQYAMAEKIKDLSQMSGDLGLKAAILLEMGKHDDALAAFEKSVQLSDKSQTTQKQKENARLFHHFNVATVAIAKNDIVTAQRETEQFRKGAEANKNQIQMRLVHELWGRIALAQKEYDKAIAELQQANDQNPYNLYRLSLAYQAKGDKERAKEFSSRAARFNGLPALNYAFIRMKAEKLIAGA
ncbi:MAG: tetratricopeptide repeat protein [Ignavibacteriae bacterium]|nr:tetratricopeptide repeat protein [Ignavibacteriota bacterium]